MGSDQAAKRLAIWPKNSGEATGLRRAAGGDQTAVQEILAPHRDRPKGKMHLSLATHLLGRLKMASQATIKPETRLIVQNALIKTDFTDREGWRSDYQTAQGDSVADTWINGRIRRSRRR